MMKGCGRNDGGKVGGGVEGREGRMWDNKNVEEESTNWQTW